MFIATRLMQPSTAMTSTANSISSSNSPPRVRKSDLFEQIQRGIQDLHDVQGKTPVIILDEAHLIDHDTLQELILITNFQMDSKLPFVLVLIGQPDLRDRLKRRMHEPLNQRITLRYHYGGPCLR